DYASGGGGGGADASGNGGSTNGKTGGTGISPYGGSGANGVDSNQDGANGIAYGGGGSGGAKTALRGEVSGGRGAQGRVIISYTINHPEINVTGSGNDIVSHSSPQGLNDTDFGSTPIITGTITKTFI